MNGVSSAGADGADGMPVASEEGVSSWAEGMVSADSSELVAMDPASGAFASEFSGSLDGVAPMAGVAVDSGIVESSGAAANGIVSVDVGSGDDGLAAG